MTIEGNILFDGKRVDVYSSLEEPLFRAADIARMIEYSSGNTTKMLEMCEEDEKLTIPMVVAGQRRRVYFVTETGLYNILSQSRKPIARKWRRIIHDELIQLRKSRNYNIAEQFEEWNHELDSLYFDEETGMMMQSVTTAGGDVEQIPYNK